MRAKEKGVPKRLPEKLLWAKNRPIDLSPKSYLLEKTRL
jgi:hypothetical protein